MEAKSVYIRIYDDLVVAKSKYVKYSKSRWNRIIETMGGVLLPFSHQDHLSTKETPYGEASIITYGIYNGKEKYKGWTVSVFIIIGGLNDEKKED